MDYTQLLSRSFEITRKFRVLWLFGIILAIFSGGGGGGGSGGGGNGGRGGTGIPNVPDVDPAGIVPIIIAAVCVALLFVVIAIVLATMARAALVGLVAELEQKQTTPTVRRGFGIGRARFAPILGLTVVLYGPLILAGICALLVALAPLFSALPRLMNLRAQDEIFGQLVAMGIGSLFLLVCGGLVFWLAAMVLHPLYQFFVRECVVNQRGVRDSMRAGWQRVRANLGDVAVLYIVTIAVGIGYAILMIPITLILVGIPAGIAIAAGLTTSSVEVGAVIGICFGLPALAILVFIRGLYEVFDSTLWTEGFLAVSAKGQA